jgi:hypothetical protein
MCESDLDDLVNSASDYLAWISNNDIPDPLPIFGEYYDNYFDEETGLDSRRLEIIEAGAKPTSSEYKILLNAFLSKSFNGDFHGENFINSAAFISPTKKVNEWQVILTEGTSFEGTYSYLFGSYPTKEDAIRDLCDQGYLEGHKETC